MTTESMSDGKHAIILLSGDMDSAMITYETTQHDYELYALHTSYGQKTELKEYDCTRELVDELDTRDSLHIETSHLKQIGAPSLTDNSMVVVGTDVDADDIPTSYVPSRNINLPSMAASYVEASDCDIVFVGAHLEDCLGCLDYRPGFFNAFETIVDVGMKPNTTISLEVPFIHDSKINIIRRGLGLSVPFEHTWFCYRAEGPACNTYDSRAFHLQAFQNLGECDPVPCAERSDYADGDANPDAAQAT